METGDLSRIQRGRNTTRHSELFELPGSGAGDPALLMDTPGFTSLLLPALEAEELRFYFPEIQALEGQCRFRGCVHMAEPDCAVKAAAAAGTIDAGRYESYRSFYQELKIPGPRIGG